MVAPVSREPGKRGRSSAAPTDLVSVTGRRLRPRTSCIDALGPETRGAGARQVTRASVEPVAALVGRTPLGAKPGDPVRTQSCNGGL